MTNNQFMSEKKKPKKKRKKEAEETTPEEQEEIAEVSDALTNIFLQNDESLPEKSKLRIIGLFGDVNEEMSGDAIASLLSLKETGKKEIPEDPEDPKSPIEITYEPIELWISTWGGVAMDMFAIYDAIRMIRDDCPVHTIGIGKVMSAGVLLLAAGTKGKRKIGKNCRIMLHGVIGGHSGTIHSLENEMEEVRWIQQQHIRCLTEETDISEKHLKKLLSRKVNVYLTAEEAVDLGIVDEIF